MNQPIATLLLLGVCVTALFGCSQKEATVTAQVSAPAPLAVPEIKKTPPAYLRDQYRSLSDCIYDWGYAQKCVPVTPGSADAVKGAAFYGPNYARSYREESMVASRKEAIDGGYATKVAEDLSNKSMGQSEVKI